MGFFFWKKKQEPQSTEGEISPPPSDSSLNPSPENKDRKTQKAERYFNKGLEFLNSTSYKDRALQQFINAGNLGYIDAIHYIGLCYFKGYGTPSNPERAVEIWQKNVLKKNPLTQYMLGYCYFHGIGIERNRIVGRAYLKTAEALGNTDASILLKEDIPSQASSASANYQPSVTPTEAQSSASSAPTHEPGFLKITVRDDKYDIQYENARATVCKQSEGYLFSEKSTIKQNSMYDSQEVIKRRKGWEFARLLVPQEPDLLVLWVNQNSRLTSISQVVEFISGKKVTGIPDDATLHRLQVWTNKDNKTETARKQEMVQKSDDKASETTPIRTEIEKSGEKITKTVLPAKYAEYSNVRDEYARSIFFLIESFISDSPLKEQYFQAGREGIVRLSESGHAGAKELLYSLLYDERQKFRNQDTDIQTTRDILNSISPESRYMIFFTGANCGGIRAKIELGKCYRDGVGVIVDTKKAEFWFSTAAQSGSVEAKTLLNNLHLSAAVQPEPPKLNSSFVLFKEADMLYKRAIAYYVGDINGKCDSKNFQDYLELAIQFGSEQAKFLLNTDEKHYYTHLEAARYGSAEVKRYMQQGEFRRRLIGRIPSDILRQYFNFIDSNETSTYYYRTGHVPSQKYVDELYHLGLSYLVGDVTGRKNVSKSDACLQIAKDSGSQDAKFILDSPCKERYIYLEAAKYGSERAKRKVIELNQKGEFNGSIPDEKLKEYFQEIGLTITKFKSVTDSDAEKKSSSGKKSEKIIIDYSSANPDELYKEGLAYYVGDKTGRANYTKGLELIYEAVEAGSKEAAFSFKSKSAPTYFYLDAAKYGSERAKKRVIELNNAGYLKGCIPEKKLQEYFSKIGITPTSQQKPEEQTKSPAKDTETRKKTATSGTSTKPRTTSVSKDAEERFQRALDLYVGENGICNINRGFAELKAAKNAGHPEAARILESTSVSYQIYLAAAKRGSIPARKQIEIWRENGTLTGKISDAELKEYDKIVKKSSAKLEAQKETKEKQPVPEKPSAVQSVPKESTPTPAPKKPKKKTKVVIDKERLQEVKAEHLYTQNRLAIDYGEEEPVAKPEPVPVKPKAPAGAEADGEWGQMKSSLSKTHIQILKAILKEPGNVTKQREIAKESGSMLDILYDEINEISDEILGDLLIDEGELVEEYIEDVKSLCQ